MSDHRSVFCHRGPRLTFSLALLFLTLTPSAHGQRRGTLEFHAGRASSRQLWNGSFSTEPVQGVSFWVGINVETPVPVLAVRAGIGYVRRGSLIWDSERDPDRVSEATVSSHYLAVPIHGKLVLRLGPLAGYLFGGPTMDLLLKTGCSPEFCHLLREEKLTVLNASAGLGAWWDVSQRIRAGFEVRLTEGLSEAYAGEYGGARNRSVELLALVGWPI